MNKSTSKPEEQLEMNFFFWLGAEGELKSVSEEEFEQEQENWDGQRP